MFDCGKLKNHFDTISFTLLDRNKFNPVFLHFTKQFKELAFSKHLVQLLGEIREKIFKSWILFWKCLADFYFKPVKASLAQVEEFKKKEGGGGLDRFDPLSSSI